MVSRQGRGVFMELPVPPRTRDTRLGQPRFPAPISSPFSLPSSISRRFLMMGPAPCLGCSARRVPFIPKPLRVIKARYHRAEFALLGQRRLLGISKVPRNSQTRQLWESGLVVNVLGCAFFFPLWNSHGRDAQALLFVDFIIVNNTILPNISCDFQGGNEPPFDFRAAVIIDSASKIGLEALKWRVQDVFLEGKKKKI